jgi:predicted nucleotidyltransferase
VEADIRAVLVGAAAGREHHQSDIDVVFRLANDFAYRVELGLPLLDIVRPLLVRGRPVRAVIEYEEDVRATVGAGVSRLRKEVDVLCHAARDWGE